MTTHLAWPALPDDRSAALQTRALMVQLDKTQHLSPADLQQLQYVQLQSLAAYAARHSKHTAARFAEAGISPADLVSPETLRHLPLLTRRDLQAKIDDILCTPPAGHTPCGEVKTSGSSGEPVRMQRSKVSQIFWMAHAMRDHLWHQRDFSGKLAIIRANLPANSPPESANWGVPAALFVKTGPSCATPINRPIPEQAEWLERANPHYLLTYPNNLAALLEHGVRLPRLKEVRTIGETLSDAIRARTQDLWGVKTTDLYSSQELGMIALQCPTSGLYHVMSESLIIEVLNDKGEPCKPGETGRIVATDLNNFATPLIRYDIGDYAEVCEAPCPCGRGLPTLKRIAGRERNMIMINGKRAWPLIGFHRYRDVAPIVQYQIIQKTENQLEARFVSLAPVTPAQETQLTEIICESLGFPFKVDFTYYEKQIPPAASGKFEEFVCLLRQEKIHTNLNQEHVA